MAAGVRAFRVAIDCSSGLGRMRIQTGLQDLRDCRGGFVSIGNFDGVHRGHQQMVGRLVEQARNAAAPAVVLTFDPHPIRLLAPDRAPPLLTTLEEKSRLLAGCGVDCLIVYPTDRELLQLSPRAFFDNILRDALQAKGLVEGPNFCFGRGRAGTVETLREYCAVAGMSIEIVTPVSAGDQLVSSSAIRSDLAAGEFDRARTMLGHPYRLTGVVVRGAGRGRRLGFGTANLSDIRVLLPMGGVYAGRSRVAGVDYAAAVHIGPNPTFGEAAQKVEVHLIDFAGVDLYGEELSVDLLARVRGTQSFATVEALRAQLTEDIAAVRRVSGTCPESS